MFYFVKTPWFLKRLYPSCIWNFPAERKVIYLTFDDGPHAMATSFVLDQLRQYNAKASFFCIGKNVKEEGALYKTIIESGHRVGNHTQNHLNGWKTPDAVYIENIEAAAKLIDSDLYRPPYGKITRFQLGLLKSRLHYRVIMWDILSADFDATISGEKCADNVISNAKPGSIVIFHDSVKAFKNLETALPKVLAHFSKLGFSFEPIPAI